MKERHMRIVKKSSKFLFTQYLVHQDTTHVVILNYKMFDGEVIEHVPCSLSRNPVDPKFSVQVRWWYSWNWKDIIYQLRKCLKNALTCGEYKKGRWNPLCTHNVVIIVTNNQIWYYEGKNIAEKVLDGIHKSS